MVIAAARRYNISRSLIYRWRKRYDGTLQSLQDCSHKPHSHPNQHTDEEIDLIKNMRKKNKHTGLVVFWIKLKQKGYTHSITGLWRMIRKLELEPVKLSNIAKPYEKMSYLGQRVQIDINFIPDAYIVEDAKTEVRKFYQYTAIDEYSHYRYLEAFEEHSSYTSTIFICLKTLYLR